MRYRIGSMFVAGFLTIGLGVGTAAMADATPDSGRGTPTPAPAPMPACDDFGLLGLGILPSQVPGVGLLNLASPCGGALASLLGGGQGL